MRVVDGWDRYPVIMPNVLVAEDEAAIADAVLYALRSEGIESEH